MNLTDNYMLQLISDNEEEAFKIEMSLLAKEISRHAPHDGAFKLGIPGLYVGRDSQIDVDFKKTFFMPSLGVAAQGRKAITIGQKVYEYNGPMMHMIPVTLPVAIKTTKATPSEPFLGVRLEFEPRRISELLLKMQASKLSKASQWSAGYVVKPDVHIVNAIRRLLECLRNPGDDEMIAPLIVDEILIRLLRSPIGAHIAEMGHVDSEIQQITKAINWIRDNFFQPMKVSDLADLVHMSVSSFHSHFKSATSMSPLQYQKMLRLQEARRLMLSDNVNATIACRMVGYVSDSQFNRDYSNYFGRPPRRDIIMLRQQERTTNN